MDISQALFSDLRQAHKRLSEITKEPFTEIVRDATIQRFEFTFELSWKLLHALLKEKSIESFGPKETIRNAAKAGLIQNPAIWLTFLEARNLTTHTYKQEVAEEVYEKAKEFAETLKSILPSLEEAAKSEDL